jgi:hypothetical protein
MWGKKRPAAHPAEISIEGYDFLDKSVEVARLWVEHRGPATCLIQPDRLAEPEMFGVLMVDAIRHGARAFSQCCGVSEEEALNRIWQGVDAEREHHTSPLDTVQDYRKLS